MTRALLILLITILMTACSGGDNQQSDDWYTAQLEGIRAKYNDCGSFYMDQYGPDDYALVARSCPMEAYREEANITPPANCRTCKTYHRYLTCIVDSGDVERGKSKCGFLLRTN